MQDVQEKEQTFEAKASICTEIDKGNIVFQKKKKEEEYEQIKECRKAKERNVGKKVQQQLLPHPTTPLPSHPINIISNKNKIKIEDLRNEGIL